jgi:VCBS repeat-containing protein
VTAADGLLRNDSDGDQGTTLTVSAVNGSSAAVGGTITLTSGAKLTVKADGSYTYDPNGKFDSLAAGRTTTDSFNYTVSDGAGGTSTATATITITGVNNAPVAVADAATVAEDAVLAVPAKGVLANDIDVDTGTTLVVTAVNGNAASVGSAITLASGAKVTMKADGSYTVDTSGKYGSLAAGETVTESFSYTVSDDARGSATGKATVTITGVNDAPTVQGAIAAETAGEGEAFSRKVPANLFADIDTSDKLTLSADLTSGAALPGWLKFDAATGTFSGTPTGSDTGTITVRVTATDSSGATASTSFVLKICR